MRTKQTSSLVLLTLLHYTSAFYPSLPVSYSSQLSPSPTVESKKSPHLLAELILKNDCFAHHDSLQAIAVCLKTKLLVNLNELIRSNRTVSFSGLNFVKTESLSELDNRLDETMNEIPDDERSLSDESSQLTYLLLQRVRQFFQTRTLKVNADGNEDSDVTEESRKKKEKGGGMMIMLGMGKIMMMMKIMMMKIAMIAMKAIVIAKIALILSGILALKKLMMMQGGGGDSHGHSSHGSSDWSSRRIHLGDTSASDMAFQAYAPALKK